MMINEWFECSKYGDDVVAAATAMRKGIWHIIDDMAEKITNQQTGEARAKKSAALGAQVSVLRALQARVGNIEVSW